MNLLFFNIHWLTLLLPSLPVNFAVFKCFKLVLVNCLPVDIVKHLSVRFMVFKHSLGNIVFVKHLTISFVVKIITSHFCCWEPSTGQLYFSQSFMGQFCCSRAVCKTTLVLQSVYFPTLLYLSISWKILFFKSR